MLRNNLAVQFFAGSYRGWIGIVNDRKLFPESVSEIQFILLENGKEWFKSDFFNAIVFAIFDKLLFSYKWIENTIVINCSRMKFSAGITQSEKII